MGRYINKINGFTLGTSFNDKCHGILTAGGESISQPTQFESDLVCVVDNGMFAAVAHCYSEGELLQFSEFDGRPKRWFKLVNAETYTD